MKNKRLSALILAGMMSLSVNSVAESDIFLNNELEVVVDYLKNKDDYTNQFINNYYDSINASLPNEVRDKARVRANDDILFLLKDYICSSIGNKLNTSIDEFDFSKKNYYKDYLYLITFNNNNELNKYFVLPEINKQENVLYELLSYMDKAKLGKLNVYELKNLYYYINCSNNNNFIYDDYSKSFGIVFDKDNNKIITKKSM